MSRSQPPENTITIKYACVAQLVVQLIRNEQVAGSSPVTSSKKPPIQGGFLYIKIFIKRRNASIGNPTAENASIYLFESAPSDLL